MMKALFVLFGIIILITINTATATAMDPDLYLYDLVGGGVCDGLKATEAIVKSPYAVTVNSKGETIILDSSRIRKVDVNGVISTITDNLNSPMHLILNDQDEIIFSDSGNHRVRKIFTNGTIITIAGTGSSSPFIDNVEATSATLNSPFGLALTPQGELLITDFGNDRIRKLLTNGTLTTIAGNPTATKYENVLATDASISNPYYVAVSSSGEIYISENSQCTIRKILTNGNLIIIGGQGAGGKTQDGLLATGSQFGFINGLAISNNGSGELHFIDNHRIRKILKNGKVTTISGSYNSIAFNGDDIDASLAQLNSPYSLMITHENEILFADRDHYRARKITKDGKIKTIAGNGKNVCGAGTLTAKSVSLYRLESIAVNSKGEILYADSANTILKVARNGIISRVAGTGTTSYNGDGMDAKLAALNSPEGIVIDSNNEVIFADSGNNRVRKILTNGTIITIAGSGSNHLVSGPVLATQASFSTPIDIAVAPNDEIIIADLNNHRVVKIMTNGTLITIAGIPGQAGTGSDGVLATQCKLTFPQSVAVNSLGEIFISDLNYKIRKILTNGTIITFAGTGNSGIGYDNIPAISSDIDPGILRFNSNDELIFVERNNNIIRKILTNGTITTIAGNRNLGYSGNGLKATSSSMFSPYAVAVSPNGNVLVTDSDNNLIRIITTNATCNNIRAFDFNVCNGNGECIDMDTCRCTTNYTGQFCEKYVEKTIDSPNNNTITNSFNNTLNSTVINNDITNTTLNSTLTSDNNTLVNNNTNVLNNTLIDNNTLNNTLLNSTTNSSSIVNNTLINNNTINYMNNTLNNTLLNSTTNSSSSIVNNTLINNSTSNAVNNTNIQTPEQSSQLIIDPPNNSKNYESNYYSYYAFFAFLVIVVIIKIVIITLICICVIKRIKNKKNNNNNNEISKSSKDVELGNVANVA